MCVCDIYIQATEDKLADALKLNEILEQKHLDLISTHRQGKRNLEVK